MIKVTDLRGDAVWLNPDLIERIQQSPDTIIALLTGSSMMVQQSPEEITEAIIHFRRLCQATTQQKHSPGA
jgi:flagellar protein FlbD